jgi:hypothetical protein
MTVGALKAGDALIPIANIHHIDIAEVTREVVLIVTQDGSVYKATGVDAIEAVWLLKPSALEGRRLKWRKHAWAYHNLVGHPVMQIMAWLGFHKAAIKFHDDTTPMPRV